MIFVCSRCKKEYGEEEAKWRCDCGGYLSCKREVSFKKEDIRPERFNMWRYDAAYPLKYEELAVTYQEGMTPLAECPKAPCRLRIKMDQLMPTGSFKDRGTVMVVNYLLKRGAKRIVEDSSGNAGASVAGYCALGGRLLAFIMDFRICLKISRWSFCPVSLWFRRKTAIPFTGNLSGICQMIASFLPLQRELLSGRPIKDVMW